MKTRLRAAALSAIAVVAAGLFNVTTASPAPAAEGETCMDPIIRGSISRVVGESATIFKPVYAEFKQSGYISAICPTPLTDYRYRVSYAYDGRTVATYHSDLQPIYSPTPSGWTRTGTKIVFPTLRLSFGGYEDVTMTVTAGFRSVYSSTWCRSNEEASEYLITVAEWTGYDTESVPGVPRSRINACP
jgi:hypothetical protein